MKCPICNGVDDRIVRSATLDDRIERERRCMDCGHSWKTEELQAADVRRLRSVGEAVQKAAQMLTE